MLTDFSPKHNDAVIAIRVLFKLLGSFLLNNLDNTIDKKRLVLLPLSKLPLLCAAFFQVYLLMTALPLYHS